MTDNKVLFWQSAIYTTDSDCKINWNKNVFEFDEYRSGWGADAASFMTPEKRCITDKVARYEGINTFNELHSKTEGTLGGT